MATTNLNIRTDKAIKDQAEEIFNELGLNMTTAINIFLRTAIRQNIDYLKQLIKIFILLFGKLQILFKLIGKLNVVFHTSRAALSASILE